MVTNIREKVVERVATEEFNKRGSPEKREPSTALSRKENTINLYKCHYYSRMGGEQSKSPIELIGKPSRSRSSSKARGVDVTYLSGGISDKPKKHTQSVAQLPY
jgi:hypothetical protein